eukprot:scaffold9577_cov20-Tisochrysis_lutea.AAC.1
MLLFHLHWREIWGGCNDYARGGNTSQGVSKDHTLRYRRGDGGAKILCTDHAREALDQAFGTGTQETLATLMQLAMMDCKGVQVQRHSKPIQTSRIVTTYNVLSRSEVRRAVHMRLINPALDQTNVGSRHEPAWNQSAAELLEEALLKGRRDADQPDTIQADDNCTIVITDMCKAAVLTYLKVPGVQLQQFSRVMAYLNVDAVQIADTQIL